jgi:hypothetical protein
MARDTDFIALYDELGVGPDCAPEDLRKAYRRRVAELHPDRHVVSAEHTRRLQRLNALYDAAMSFQRSHGRLPGTSTRMPQRPHAQATNFDARSDRRATSARRRVVLFVVFAALVAAAVYFAIEDSNGDGTTQAGPGRTHVAPAAADVTPRQILVGMTTDRVLAIQGEPVARNEILWEYGPSWIAFECGQVSDWYSSTLRPLRTASAKAPEKTNLDAAAKRAADACRRASLARAAGAIP